jgi:hypothetical protein
VRVLAVNIDKQGAEGAQSCRVAGLAVDVGAGAALAGQHAPEQAVVVGIEIVRQQPVPRRRESPDVEVRADLRALAAGPDRLGSARSPRHRPRASSMMDLPAPVSPVTTVRPSAEIHFETVHDGELADGDLREHRRPFLGAGTYNPSRTA